MATATLPAVNSFPINEMPVETTVPVMEKEPKQPKPVREAVGVVVIDTATQKVLMIQSKKKKDVYVLPRDDCKESEAPKDAALRLLNAKAGVTIDAVDKEIGTFEDVNKKGRLTANHHLYEVHDITFLDNWKDSDRQRVWMSYGDALKATEKKRWSHLALQKCSLNRKMPVVA